MNFDLQNNKTSPKKQKTLQLNSPPSKIKNDLFEFFLKTPDSNYSKG